LRPVVVIALEKLRPKGSLIRIALLDQSIETCLSGEEGRELVMVRI